MRRFLIAGNWKMNNAPMATTVYFDDLSRIAKEIRSTNEVLLCVPFVSLDTAIRSAKHVPGIQIGAQNMFHENDGAYTGEVSASMLKEIGCTHVILGHSERREYFGETDELIGKKVLKALDSELTPILCVGEVLSERREGRQNDVVSRQLKGALEGIPAEKMANLVIAYEPVWAIGTGETASPEQAQEMHAYIREVLTTLTGNVIASTIRILYGGSMKPDNARELLSQPDVDGGLIGGASLKPESFNSIIEIANELNK